MISVAQAIKYIQENEVVPSPIEVPLAGAPGMVLAEDIFSPIDMPPFNQSAMDGYAIRIDNPEENEYELVGEVQAGDGLSPRLKGGEAIGISTGAMIPKNADTVVIKEHTEERAGKIRILKAAMKGANIRGRGEQIRKGESALQKGTLIEETHIGFLAGLGVNRVVVYKMPKVALIVTGNELQTPGELLQPGKIFESNSIMLEAALRRFGFDAPQVFWVRDDAAGTEEIVGKALKKADVILSSGGISVGNHDLVKKSFESNGVAEIFYKVNQKPGKPLWFGKKDGKLVFGLPGNPAASLTCFYVYVLPLLMRWKGVKDFRMQMKKARVDRPWTNSSGKALFLKGNIQQGIVHLLEGQSSSMMHSFALSNALVFIPANKEFVEQNEEVECLKLGF